MSAKEKPDTMSTIRTLRDNYIKQLDTLMKLELALRRKELGSATIDEVDELTIDVYQSYRAALRKLLP